MRPVDALPQDWHRYYEGGFMEHKTLGIVQVNIPESYDGPSTINVRKDVVTKWKSVAPNTLEPVWPDSGCYNHSGNGFCAHRTAIQNIRRTATSGHYSVVFNCSRPSYKGACRLAPDMMWSMAMNLPRPTMDEALDEIMAARSRGLAISPDLIVGQSKKHGQFYILYHDLHVGNLHGGVFVATNEGSPMTKRARIKLAEVYPQCL